MTPTRRDYDAHLPWAGNFIYDQPTILQTRERGYILKKNKNGHLNILCEYQQHDYHRGPQCLIFNIYDRPTWYTRRDHPLGKDEAR